MYNYDDILRAFQQNRVLKNILSYLMDEDIMNLNYTSKEKISITLLPKKGIISTFHVEPEHFDPSEVTKINLNFLLNGTPFQYEIFYNEYLSVLDDLFKYLSGLLLNCDNNLKIEIEAYYPFFEEFLTSRISSLTYYNRVEIDFYFKPYAACMESKKTTFTYPNFNFLQGFKNIESVTLKSDFNKGTNLFKYFIRCLPDYDSFKLNINFIGYLDKKKWRNVERIMNSLKSTKIKIGLNCWGEDGSFWYNIPHPLIMDQLKRVYRFEVHGDSFDILRKFNGIFEKMENLQSLICNFHVYEYIFESFDDFSKKVFEKMDICHELKKLTKLTNVVCNFNYIYDFNHNNLENLNATNYTFDKLLDSLPSSVTKLSIIGIKMLDLKLAEKIHTLLPNLIYLSISKINDLDENFLLKLPNVRFIVSHACRPVKIPPTISVCGSVCCVNSEPIDCVDFFNSYWRYCYCTENHKAWKKSIEELKRYQKTLERFNEYNINIFYNEINHGWNVLKEFTKEHINNLSRDTYFRRKLL